MELSKQVISLEISKKLKELGVKQESFLTWVKSTECPSHREGKYKLAPFNEFYGAVHDYYADGKNSKNHPMFSAFTVAELGEILPQVVKKDEKLYYINPSANGNGLKYMDYTTYENGVGTFLRAYPLVDADTEANARGKMLIYLLENNLTK